MKSFKKILIRTVAFFAILIALLYIFKVDYLITAVRKIYFNGHITAFLDATPNLKTAPSRKAETLSLGRFPKVTIQ